MHITFVPSAAARRQAADACRDQLIARGSSRHTAELEAGRLIYLMAGAITECATEDERIGWQSANCIFTLMND